MTIKCCKILGLGPNIVLSAVVTFLSMGPIQARYFGGLYQDQDDRMMPAVLPELMESESGLVPISALEALAQAPVVDSSEVSFQMPPFCCNY